MADLRPAVILPADRHGASRWAVVLALAIVVGGAALWVVRIGSNGPDRAWWRGAAPPSRGPGEPSRRDPASLYREKCLPCHALGGEGGTYGSDLGEAGRRLTPALIAAYVRAPSAVEPGTRMPPVRGLTGSEIDSLAAWVVERARAGVAP